MSRTIKDVIKDVYGLPDTATYEQYKECELQLKIFSVTQHIPHHYQMQVHKALARGCKNTVAVAGRRGAKSDCAIYQSVTKLGLKPKKGKATYKNLVFAPQYSNAQEIYKNVYDIIQVKNIYGCKASGWDKKNLKLQMPWGSELIVYSTDNPESILSVGADNAIIEEAQSHRSYIFRQYIEPTLSDNDAPVLFIGTPRGRANNLCIDYEEALREVKLGNPRYAGIHWTSYDNPYLAKGWVERKRQWYLLNGNYRVFEQEYLAKFVASSGAVYPEFERNKDGIPWHVDHVELDPTQPISIGMDLGYTNETVFNVGQKRAEDRLVVLECYAQVEMNMRSRYEKYEELRKKWGGKCSWVMPDPHPPENAMQLEELGTPTLFGRENPYGVNLNPSVTEGIERVRNLFARPDRAIIINNKHCEKLIDDLEAYRYPTDIMGDVKVEKPEKINDHTCDALRYWVTACQEYDYDRIGSLGWS